MEPGAEEISAGSNSSGMHSLQCSSQQQVNMHQQQTEEIQQQGEQQHQQLMQEWQQQLEDPSDQQEQFELDQTQHPEQSQLQPYVQNEHLHLEPPQLQQKQQWQPDQQQQLQQVQMQQMLQHTQQQHLQEMHSQQLKLQQSQDQQELVTQLQQQLQPQQQESSSQSEHQDMEVQLQQQELPLQELELQLQEQELALQLQQQQQQQLPPQIPHEHLKQLPQTQQQQLEQSPAEPQQQHLQQLQQSQQHLQQPQQQQHSQHFPVQPQQQYVPQSQQQPQQSSLEPQHQHLQPLSQHQQLPLHSQQQHLPQPQQQTQQQLQLLSQHQQQSQQLPLQSQEQHLPQSQQRPQQQLQQSTLPSQHQHLQQLPQPQQQPQLQQVPLPSQQHLQQLAQSQQQPQQKLQQMSLQQQQQHLQQSQQQAQQHLQQASMSSHQQTQQQMPQPQQQLPHPQQQHLQPLSQPQKQHLQQLPQSQQQRSQQLPQAQQQLQQPQSQQQRSQLQPHLQQLSQSQQQLQQKQLQPQVQQQQQQQLSSQHPSQSAVGQAATSVRGQNISGNHSISFGSLIPMILPHLSKEQSERLQGLYTKLRRNEVTKEDFLRATRNVVGDQMLVQAVRQMQQKHQGQSQLASSSQASQLHQQQQQQQQRQQQHVQGSSQQFMAQQSIHTQQLNEPQPFQQVSPTNLQTQAQRTSDFQPHSQSSAPASLTVSHSSSDNKTQQSRQPGEPHPEISSVHVNQTSTMNLHHVKHEVDRTMIGFPLSSQQQQQHLQVPSSSFPMYGRPPGNYSSQPFSASPGLPPGGVKVLAQDSQPKQVVHPQVGVQAHGGPPQLSNIKNMPKYDLSKQGKRREDEERQKILQSSGAAHFSGQHQPSVWATSLDKEKAGNTGISPSSSVHIKQEISDNSDQQLNIQTLQPMKADSVEHQSIKTSGISSVNHPLGSSGLHSDHLMQAPLATSAATLHHTLSGFNGPVQMRPQVPSTPPSSMVGSQIKTPPKKMLIGQKKLFDGSGPSMQLASKKQKVSAGYLDQSIDQLNDVTAVSGVNLREEEEQLFAGPKEESRATEAMRKVVQEEEERIFLQKGSLRAKLDGIMAKYGIKYISSDSERCLSLCVEERLRTMIGHLIRLSKQRVDLERASHKVTITSDVRRQILAMNKKAKDDLEKKQAEEAEKLRKLNEIENVGPEGEKDETRTKAQKAQKEEDDKMRANAANVAARAAVGGDDMLSKWQLMAEQARQKREGTSDGASNTRTNRDANRKSVVGGLKSSNVSDHQDAPSTGVVRNLGRTSGPLSQTKPVRSICIKDVIALLEREPQMTKSTLLYRLYERGVDYSKEKGTEIQNNENTLQ